MGKMGTTNMPRTHSTKGYKLCAKPPKPKPGPRDNLLQADFSRARVTAMHPGDVWLPMYDSLTVPKP